MNNELDNAVAIVQKEISNLRAKYESIAKEDGQDPIMIEGETIAGYAYQLLVDPKEVARILVDYDYALYRALREEAPYDMWEDLGRKFGIKYVCAVDM